MEINIREERAADHKKVYQLIKEAFENAQHTDGDEHELVERLRHSETFVPALSLVAEQDGEIVGHILFTEVKIDDATAIALSPVAVAPGLQGKGIGGKLIRAGHEIARDRGYEISVVLGHADYYPRFGYSSAKAFGIRAPFEVPDENFMACNLQGKETRLDGVVEYAQAFFEK